MIENILVALLIVASVGIVCAVLLALASHFLHVEEDKKMLKIRECLPGVNCGACGYTGCDDYAKALANDNVKTNLCIPGSDSVAAEIAEILGVEAEDVIEMIAHVRCNGNCNVTTKFAHYQGINSCAAAMMVYGGIYDCRYGCLGCGDCEKVCPSNAICVHNGVAHINNKLCVGCGLCAKQCPKNIIEIFPQVSRVAVMCNNTLKGAVARKTCKNACIGCKKCETVCPSDAIKVENNLAHVDYSKCSNCGKCAEACPTKCIKLLEPIC